MTAAVLKMPNMPPHCFSNDELAHYLEQYSTDPYVIELCRRVTDEMRVHAGEVQAQRDEAMDAAMRLTKAMERWARQYRTAVEIVNQCDRPAVLRMIHHKARKAIKLWGYSNWLNFINWLAMHLRCRVIDGPGGEPYLVRFYLFGFFGLRFYLHRFLDSDPDRGLHDHPWLWARALVLAGGYDELVMQDYGKDQDYIGIATMERRAGRINCIAADTFHRIVMPADAKETWTLFCHGRRVKGWGFLHYALVDRNHVMGLHVTQEWDHKYITEEAVPAKPTEYEPYALTGAWDKADWWKHAPKGREVLQWQNNASAC